MVSTSANPTTCSCHVVAMPYPGRGHINPMMNLCKLLFANKPDILISFILTEEWFGFIGNHTKPDNIRFCTIPNIIPSEIGRADDLVGFVQAISTKMEAPFEQLLDRLDPKPDVIVADTYLVWTASVANRRNIPMASFWTQSATMYSEILHFHLLEQNGIFPVQSSERGDELVDYIPGVSSTRVADLLRCSNNSAGKLLLPLVRECVDMVKKAQYLLFTNFYELESMAIDTIRSIYPFPVYTIGPSIPYLELNTHLSVTPDYLQWLNCQPEKSVLYISCGSFLSTSKAQMDEFVAGIKNSKVRFIWVVRGDATRIEEDCGKRGLVVPWCDQLRVLSHCSVGGFWSHCGWNSTIEAVFAGVPVLSFPLIWDQFPNRKLITEDWGIGWSLRREDGGEKLLKREEIEEIVERFMNGESNEGKEMRKRSEDLKEVCRQAVGNGGSSNASLDHFIENISKMP